MLEIWDLTFWPQLIERGGGVILEGSEPRSHLASVKQPHGGAGTDLCSALSRLQALQIDPGPTTHQLNSIWKVTYQGWALDFLCELETMIGPLALTLIIQITIFLTKLL